MWNSKKIIWVIILLILLIWWGYYFFTNTQKEELAYTITTNTGTQTPVEQVVQTGAIETEGRKNLQIVAYLSESTGKVEKITSDGASSEIKNGEVVSKNDTILTKENSSASLIFIDNSVVRLSANSRITITKKVGKNIEVTLMDGDVWARVLKPLYDSSFFTIKTADVSAWVRGTSIRIKKTADKITITVIDSFSPDAKLAGADIEQKDTKKFLGVEHSIEINLKDGKQIEKKEDKKSLLTDDFIRQNTKRDLVYMDTLRWLTGNKNLMDKLNGEFKVSMPSHDEMVVMFDEKQMQEKLGKMLLDSRKPVTDADMLDMIKKDVIIASVRQEIIWQSGGGTLPPEKKKELEDKVNMLINSGALDFAPYNPLLRPLKEGEKPVGELKWRDILNLAWDGSSGSGVLTPEPTKEQAPDCTPELLKQNVQCRMIGTLPPVKPTEPKPVMTPTAPKPPVTSSLPKPPVKPASTQTPTTTPVAPVAPKPVEPKPIPCGNIVCLPSQRCVNPVIISGEIKSPARCAD